MGASKSEEDMISKAVPITCPIFINEPMLSRALAFTKVQEINSAKSLHLSGKVVRGCSLLNR